MKKIAIITLLYNKLEEATKPYLESLYKYSKEDIFDLILVDNGSSDKTAQFIADFQKNHSNIKIITNKQNLGFSKGNNQGLSVIKNKNYEFIGLLNNDILFTPNWIEKTLEAFSEDQTLGMVSPRIQKGKSITKDNYLKKYPVYLKKFKNKIKYSTEPLFCCVFIKKQVVDTIGFLDENFTPAFYEDNDYCFRAMYKGYSLAISNQSFVFHNHSTTSRFIDKSIPKRNREYFLKKHPLAKFLWENKRTNLINDIKKYIIGSFDK